MINTYPFNDDIFWSGIVSAVNTFLTNKVEEQGTTILDREMTQRDIDFMNELKIKNMVFENEEHPDTFTIKNKQNNNHILFSNRPPTNGEMRGINIRTKLLEKNWFGMLKHRNLTLYEALDRIFRNDVRQNDVLTYFIGAVKYDYEAQKNIDPKYVDLIKDIAHSMVQYKKSNPEATDDEMIAHGKIYKPSNLTARIVGVFLFALGITLAFAPIPGLAQILGSWLSSVGAGISAGTLTLGAGLTAAVIGLGMFSADFFSFSNRDKAPKISVEHSPEHTTTDDLDGFQKQTEVLAQLNKANTKNIGSTTEPATEKKAANTAATINTPTVDEEESDIKFRL